MKQTVLKQGDSRVASLGNARLDLRDIGREAETIIRRARAEAQRIIETAATEAAAQAESIRRSAHQKGYDEGLARGAAAGQEQAVAEARAKFSADQGELVKVLSAAVHALGSRREQLYVAAKRDCVVLAIAIAGRIIRRFREDSIEVSAAAVDAASDALAVISGASSICIRVHPEDRLAMDRFAEQVVQAAGSSARSLEIIADPEQPRGGISLQAGDCTIEGDMDARLERIAADLVSDYRKRMSVLNMNTAEPTSPADQAVAPKQ